MKAATIILIVESGGDASETTAFRGELQAILNVVARSIKVTANKSRAMQDAKLVITEPIVVME